MRRGIPVERIKKWIAEGGVGAPTEADKAYVKMINETYLAEKADRHKAYAERRAARIEARKKLNGAAHERPINKDAEEKERIDMIQKLEELKLKMLIEEAKGNSGGNDSESEVT